MFVSLYQCMEKISKSVSFDDMIDILAAVQRRKLLVALLDHNPQDDSPVVIAGSESDAEAMDRLVKMRHVHLPKLVDCELIEWDEDSHEVSKGPKFDEIKPLLELLANHENELPDGWL